MGTFGFCTAKTMMGLLGLSFFLAGFTCIGIGSLVIHRYYTQLSSFENFSLLQVPAIMLIFVGIIFFIAGCSGCCNLFKESKGCLGSFFTFLFVVVALMIVAASLGVVYRNEINEQLDETLNRTLHEYNQTESMRKAIDDLQQRMECCGINGSEDWLHIHEKVPDSCFAHPRKPEDKPYQEGCYNKLRDFLNKNFGWIITGTVILLIILIIGMIAACGLMCYKKNDNYFTLS